MIRSTHSHWLMRFRYYRDNEDGHAFGQIA